MQQILIIGTETPTSMMEWLSGVSVHYMVIHAQDLAEALSLCQTFAYQVVVTPAITGEHTAFRLLQEIAMQEHQPRVILVCQEATLQFEGRTWYIESSIKANFPFACKVENWNEAKVTTVKILEAGVP